MKSLNQSHKMDWVSKTISANVKMVGADWCEPSPPSLLLGRGATGARHKQQHREAGTLFKGGGTVNLRLQTEQTHPGSKEQLSSGEALYRGYISPLCEMPDDSSSLTEK